MDYNEACLNYPAIFLIIEPETGNIVAANKKAAQTYGYSIEQLCTMKIYDINVLKPEQLKEEIYHATVKRRTYFHFPHKTAAGKIINMEVECYPTTISQKTYLFSTIHPSNERNIYVNASLNLMDKSSDSLMVLDQSHRIIKLNKCFETMFNCQESEVIGEDGYTILSDLEKEKYQLLIAAVEKGDTKKITFHRTLLQQTLHYSITAIPIFYLQSHFGAVFSIRQICHGKSKMEENNLELTKKLVELEKTHSVKNDFLARMSHDMRTPMNAILSIAQFGMEDIEDKKAHKYFTQIKDSSEYLLALIDDILDMQKLESGEITLNNVIIDASRIAEKVKTIIEPRAAEKDITLSYVLECEKVYRFVKVDEKRIEQVLINILNNAIKYTPQGGKVTWRNYAQEMPDGRMRISHEISDTGVGMSPEFQKKMFEPFTTECNSQTKYEGGNGLGLAITKNLISAMGGSIDCKSELGEGTTFYIEIFLNPATDQEVEAIRQASKPRTEEQCLKGKRILICEDIEINVLIVKKMLYSSHCIIDIARNGKEGVELARKNQYFAILMDIRMPLMDGLQATQAIRKFNTTVPIIALSANAYESDIQKSLQQGMNAHLAKPVNKISLYSTLKKFLD